jgi:iron complex transport system ATP-binding protein
MTIALQAASVGASLSNTPVLCGVEASFGVGRWTSIVGPNGAGKSTLLKVLAGLLPFEGDVRLLDKPLAAWSAKARARTVAWLGQSGVGGEMGGAGGGSAMGGGGGADMSAYDVVMLGRLPHRAWLAPPSGADSAAVAQALHQTQAWDVRHRSLSQLSGGERQRVLLARLLAVEADVVLMDEPLANLDPPHQADWLRLVRTLTSAGKTVVSVLHEISVALQADDMLIMAGGRMIHQGLCSDSHTQRALQDVFARRITIHAVDGQPMVRLMP